MFGYRLRNARKKMNLTLDELAEKYNIKFDGKLSKGTLSKYENEKQEPMISVVNNLATLLNVSVDYLIVKSDDDDIFQSKIPSPSSEDNAPATDDDIKFALFNSKDGITDEMLDEVKEFAKFVKSKYKK